MPLSIIPIFDDTSLDNYEDIDNNSTLIHNNSTPVMQQYHNSSPSMSLDGCYINGNIRFVKKIGAGTFGLIYLVEDTLTQTLYAAKLILKKPPRNSNGTKSQDIAVNKKFIQEQLYMYFHNKEDASPKNIVADELPLEFLKTQCGDCTFLKEISSHLQVHEHPNVTTIHKVLNLSKMAVVILMDYCHQGDLFHNIIDNQIFVSTSDVDRIDKQLLMKNVILQLIDVIKYCQQKSIFHCDLKPENIMVNYNPHYKRTNHSKSHIVDYNEIQIMLIDFGLAMDNPLICCNVCRGSSFYMAPERITNYTGSNLIKTLVDLSKYQSVEMCDSKHCNSNKYFPTIAGDIWSLAVLFINITCSRNPWPIASIDSINDRQVFHNYILGNNPSVLRDILPISRQFNDLLNKIFVMDPSSRLSLDEIEKEIKNTDFFNDELLDDDEDNDEVRDEVIAYNNVGPSPADSLFSPKNCSSHSSFSSSTQRIGSFQGKAT
ncbi:hypothetical protein CLIB1423_02S01398 [[Candida] railenensis]|uniref:Protein kinase domain-containing protein n=1 Tax=[Candida] railenensis TaxID=45579 RepID=A0A9P0VVU8_9ASCO|nr:hypothetical protein CLIB1423_02S01398 [[Candida] railenensis]